MVEEGNGESGDCQRTCMMGDKRREGRVDSILFDKFKERVETFLLYSQKD